MNPIWCRQDQDIINLFTGDYTFLSNFYMLKSGTSVEHQYQAHKAMTVVDSEYVMSSPTPSEAKRRGKLVPCCPDWDDIKDSVMLLYCTYKFDDPELQRKLLDTGDAILAEGNWWRDRYWGVTYDDWNGDHFSWTGQNKLGNILMSLRQKYMFQNKLDSI